MAAPGVLFDIDGTLVDSNYLHALAWFRAFDAIGRFVPMATIHHHVGMGSDKLMPKLIGEASDEADERHGAYYEECHGLLRAFPRVPDLLRAVKARGPKVVLATSAKQRDLEALAAAIDAGDAVDHVTSSADVDRSKPDPDIFGTAIEVAGLDRSRTIVVGDTVWDVHAAAALGLDCVCVLTGGIARETLEAAGAVAVYEDAAALLAGLDDSPLARLWR